MQEIKDHILLWIPNVGIAVAIFAGFWLLSRVFKATIQKAGKRLKLKEPVVQILSETVKIILLVFGAITALGTLGVDVSALVAGLGLTGFALGFALKDTIANLVAGILILVYQPFDLADYIVISGKEGKVISIDLRYTILENQEKKILIPNSLIFANTVTILNRSE